MVRSGEAGRHLPVRICRSNLFPALRREVVREHRYWMAAIGVRGLAFPRKRHHVASRRAADLHLEQLSRDRAVRCGRLVRGSCDDFISRKGATLAKTHMSRAFAHVHRQVRRRCRNAVAIGVGIKRHIRVVVLDGELHLRGLNVAGPVASGHGKRVLAH